ncbi:TRAP transporter large permease subunit [uncultured Desulfosarcina sp.]|uniref:TRAP transporter large permease n=1 Tax=uncultured Desulfosarcina sp. TaxID=218289 RepID=UPI0029C70EBF|nr:TRAP transporter large permease subunit [uncultured Desulfosarcina sp.]
MSVTMLSILFFGAVLICLLMGLPLSFSLGGVSIIFLYFTWGPESFYMQVALTWGNMNKFTLVAIPMFIFMAMIMEQAGMANALYDAMYLWFGGLGGGLAVGTCVICAIFGAMCGVSGAAVVTMGTIALPSMLKYKYDKSLALGCINAGGSWGILIPPSVTMILYCLLTGESVGKMFAAGVMPGLLCLVMVSSYILIRCFFNPSLGPPIPEEERGNWKQKIISLKSVILPIIVVLMVLGSIMGGVTTPTEAAAMGILGSLISAKVYGQLKWPVVKEASIKTLRVSSMIMWIIFGAYSFSSAYDSMGAAELMKELMIHIPGGRWGAIIFMQAILLFLGMLLDPAGIMMICLPVFLPVVEYYKFDTLWFGILFVMNMELGYMTPPFGFNLFYLKGIVPRGITMADIYRSVIGYAAVQLAALIVIMIFPDIATWLAYKLLGGPS